ncbi:hypothetical protein B0J13DRAFT_567235 [Dactylonectria estremocensis]|uniref:C2H2-type domain-containing protein n=1 Tax=Dactylonectria estremocensis TaxID=1079267 RepID=A0A9P9DLL5_9HYPO|nr:hypothetical protein B0J13DRAFT_567235 [Dactylonectria estremocensis]
MGAPGSASGLALQCLTKFDECLLNDALAQNQWAENRRADFCIWVDGVGALAGKNASLDARFVSKPRELILTLNLLLQLHNYLGDSLNATGRKRLEEAKRNADAAIENLASMAVAIRRTGRKSRLIRADRGFTSPTLGDFRIHLQCVIRFEPTLPSGEQPLDQPEDPLWWQDLMDADLAPLQQRLIDANLLRRNRFLYAQKHSQKLALWSPTAESEYSPPIEQKAAGRLAVERPPIRLPKGQLPVEYPLIQPRNLRVPKLPDFPALSETWASVPESKLKWTEPRKIVRAPQTQISFVTAATLYPKLRKSSKPEEEDMDTNEIELPKMLKCPCCCEAIPHNTLETETAWKQHLSRDLCPYTCIASNCSVPHLLFRTRAEWEDHLKEQHPKTWKCQLCDDPEDFLFHTDNQLVEHVREEHMDSFPPNLLKTVRLWPSSPLIGLDTCPLCDATGPRDSPNLINHVLEHTHNFALRSLPWADIPVDNYESHSTLGMFNVGYLQPLKPTHPDTSLRPWLMHVWFETLEIPRPKRWGWEEAEAALKDLAASRADKDVGPNTDHFTKNEYFTMNNYFASDADSLSLDQQTDRTLSRGSFNPESTVDLEENAGEQSQTLSRPGLESRPMAETWENAEELTRWGGWSDWNWSQDYQRHYRQRQDINGTLDTQWQRPDIESNTPQSNNDASTKDIDFGHLPSFDEKRDRGNVYVNSQFEDILNPKGLHIQNATEANRGFQNSPHVRDEQLSEADEPYCIPIESPPKPRLVNPNSSYFASTSQGTEELDPRYRVEPSHKFQPGKIFKILWCEPQGSRSTPSASKHGDYEDRYGGRFFVSFRRFIIIASDQDHSTCVSVLTYGRQGCKKRGTLPEKHGIICEKGRKARLLPGEPLLGFAPVKVETTQEYERLAGESRVNYSKLYTVPHDWKVFFFGHVVASDYDIVADAVNQCWEEKIHRRRKRAAEEGPPAKLSTDEDET